MLSHEDKRKEVVSFFSELNMASEAADGKTLDG